MEKAGKGTTKQPVIGVMCVSLTYWNIYNEYPEFLILAHLFIYTCHNSLRMG